MAYVKVLVPLSVLKKTPASPRFREQVLVFERRYRSGLGVPPIPVKLDIDGNLSLRRDGNHRLKGARLAGIEAVTVDIDERDAPRLTRKIAKEALKAP